jgi:hypothetical protein
MNTEPDWLELFLEKDEYTEIDDLAALVESLKRIKENPTELEKEMDNTDLQQMLWINWMNTREAFPRRFSDIPKFAQTDCIIHNIDSKIMLNIAKHLTTSEMGKLRRSCKFFDHSGHLPKIYEESYLRTGFGPHPPTWWGFPHKSWHWGSSLRNVHFAKEFLDIMSSRHKPMADLLVELRNLYLKYHVFTSLQDAKSADYAWTVINGSFFQMPSHHNAVQITSLETFWFALSNGLRRTMAPAYLEQVPIMTTVYLGAMLFGSIPDWVDFSPLFYSLWGSAQHTQASASLAVHFGHQRLREMDFQFVSDSSDNIFRLTAAKLVNAFDLNGIWHGVMHYTTPNLEKTYSEEMAMKLEFPSPQEDPVEPLPFEMIGVGVDSLGEFEIEDAVIDHALFSVRFTKVYSLPAADGVLKHEYTGVLYPFGIGGHFGTAPDEMGVQQIGTWFIGRPKAYSGGSLAIGDTLVEEKIGAWDDLVVVIKGKAEENEKKRSKILSDLGIASSYFDDDPTRQIYDLPMISDIDTAIFDQREALRYRTLARTESTPISELRLVRSEAQESLKDAEHLFEQEAALFDLIFFETDNDEKTALRLQLLTASNALFSVSIDTFFRSNAQLYPQFLETLEKHDYSLSSAEVRAVLKTISSWVASPPHTVRQDIVTWLNRFKTAIQTIPTWDQDDEDLGMFQEYEELLAEDNAVAPKSIPEVEKLSRKGKTGQRQGLSNSTLVVAGSIAMASIVAAAFVVGRFLFKRSKE